MATDVRIYDGSQWVSIKGPKGDTGAPGAKSTITINPAVTGAPGSQASVTDSNPSPNDATLTFTIPRGDAGQAATIQIAGTNTGAPGTQALVTNLGTANAANLSFTIPRGEKGEAGSGVTIKGTLTGAGTALPATPASGDMYILGNPVPTAAPNGAGGTKAEGDGIVWNGTAWTNVGPIRGPQGNPGDPGIAATITVNSNVTSLPSGSSPTVTNTGTSQAAILNFGIPQGAKGDPGQNYEVFNQAATPTGMSQGAIWIVP